MSGKVFTSLIVAFWLVMMTALVRMEYFPTALHRDTVPPFRVLSRIFANTEPVNLSVYYQNKWIGTCKVEIDPQTSLTNATPPVEGQRPGAYALTSTLWLDMKAFGTPNKMLLIGKSKFTKRYDVSDFDLSTEFANHQVTVHGDPRMKVLKMTVEGEHSSQKRVVRYADLGNADILSELGLSGLLGLPEESRFGGLGLLTAMMPPSSASRSANQSMTQIYRDNFVVGGIKQPAFVIESKFNPALWAKIWVGDAGSVLQVDTSLGLSMRPVNDYLDPRPTQPTEISQKDFEP
jgi:hypothetical protein